MKLKSPGYGIFSDAAGWPRSGLSGLLDRARNWQSFAHTLVSEERDTWRRPRIAGFTAPEIELPIERFPKRLAKIVWRVRALASYAGCARLTAGVHFLTIQSRGARAFEVAGDGNSLSWRSGRFRFSARAPSFSRLPRDLRQALVCSRFPAASAPTNACQISFSARGRAAFRSSRRRCQISGQLKPCDSYGFDAFANGVTEPVVIIEASQHAAFYLEWRQVRLKPSYPL